MEEHNLEQLDRLRKQGFRPGFVGLIVKDKKVLFLYQREYDLWGFPQGGIANKETPLEAIDRVSRQELGEEFTESLDMNVTYLGEDRIEFRPDKSDVQDLFDDDGTKIKMLGKHYFFYLISSSTEKMDLTKSVYSQARLVTYAEAMELIDKIYQQGKQRITKKAVELLKENSALS